MYANQPFIAQQLAYEYTRDRIRRADAARTARSIRASARRDMNTTSAAPGRRRPFWALHVRTA